MKIQIDGYDKPIEVDDSFADKSKDEQDSIVNEIGSSLQLYNDGNRLVDDALYDLVDQNTVDLTTGIDIGSRALMAVTNPTEQESINIFKALHPSGDIKKVINRARAGHKQVETPGYEHLEPNETFLMFKYKSDDIAEPWKPIDPYVPFGHDVGEVADYADILPYTAGGIYTAVKAAASGLSKRTGLQSVTAFLTSLGTQLFESAAGVQEESVTDILQRASGEAALAGVAEPISSTIPALRNRARFGADFDSSDIAYYLGRGKELENIHVGTELDPLPTYLHSEGKGPLKMIGRFGSRSAHGERQTIDMLESAYNELTSLRGGDATSIDKGVLNYSAREYDKQMNAILGGTEESLSRESAVGAGKNFIDFAENFVTKSRGEVAKLYDQVDKYGADVSIGVTEAKAIAREIDDGIKAISKEFDSNIDVSDPNLGALRGVVNDLMNMSDVQVNYEAIKQLRTRLFKLIDNDAWGWRYSNMLAKNMWDSLTDSMLKQSDDIGRGVSGRTSNEFISSLKNASKAHRSRMDVFQNKKIVKALKAEKGDLTPQLGEMFMQPHTHTKALYGLIQKYNPDTLDSIRGFVYNRLLNKPNPLRALDDWQVKNPESYSLVFGGKNNQIIRDAAESISTLLKSPLKGVMDRNMELGGQVFMLIRQNRAPDARRLIAQFENNELAAKSVISHMVKESSSKLRGKAVLEHGSFQKMLLEIENSDIGKTLFSGPTFKRLKNLELYLDALNEADSGVGIAEGAMGKNLLEFTNPGAIMSALRAFGMNDLVARALAKDGVGDKIASAISKYKLKRAKKEKMSMIPWSIGGQILKEASKDYAIEKETVSPSDELKQIQPNVGGIKPYKDASAKPMNRPNINMPQQPQVAMQQSMPPQQPQMLPPSMRNPMTTLGQAAQTRGYASGGIVSLPRETGNGVYSDKIGQGIGCLKKPAKERAVDVQATLRGINSLNPAQIKDVENMTYQSQSKFVSQSFIPFAVQHYSEWIFALMNTYLDHRQRRCWGNQDTGNGDH